MGKFGVIELGAAQKIAHREGEIDRIDILSDAVQKLIRIRSWQSSARGNRYSFPK